MTPSYEIQRSEMVEEQIVRRGIDDPRILSAFHTIPRHKFVPDILEGKAYADTPLPIGEGQTISQPYIVALMTKAARVDSQSRVLEVGTGSGYQAAILSQIVKEVYSIERIASLAERAEGILRELGCLNVQVKVGDGTLGWPDQGPYDAILVTAGAPVVPESLAGQLKSGGHLIIPVGDSFSQVLVKITRNEQGELEQTVVADVRFVPLIGQEGWHVS